MREAKPSDESQSDQRLVGVAMEYVTIVRRVYYDAKQPNFSAADWAALAELLSVDDFEYVNHNCEVWYWREYTQFLTKWAQSIVWEPTIGRVHQWQNVVFLEHEAQYSFDDRVDVVRSVSIFEFNKADKIQRIGVYLQQKPSLGL